ncbi:hypothetical protein CSUB01_07546 [Colletotrichum sublineola]|uniref:Uncharacterized protein n=1 Tax=Colletotrichum sublineola TaxID=1173701 RepID=A0A066XR03_COLSU|nr:hypothetical protein CSUB01_07546 [Colletotrichum sublineola]
MPATLTSAATPESTIKMMVFRVLSAVALLFYVAIYLPVSLVRPSCNFRPNRILSCAPLPTTTYPKNPTPLSSASTSSLPAGTRCLCGSRRKGSPTFASVVRQCQVAAGEPRTLKTESPARRRDRVFAPSLLFPFSYSPPHGPSPCALTHDDVRSVACPPFPPIPS